jgi:hypothetical protein
MEASGQSANELGRLLAAAQGYAVFTHRGTAVGALERVRYETQVAHPDDIVVCSRGLFRRRRSTFPFESVYAVSAHEGKVVLRPDAARTEGRRAACPPSERRYAPQLDGARPRTINRSEGGIDVAFRHELCDTHGTYKGTFVTDTERWQIGDAFTDGDGRALRITDIAAPEHSNQRPTYTDRWIVEPIQAATSQRDTSSGDSATTAAGTGAAGR